MIFSELYGAYYNTVAAVLRKAVQRPLTKEDLRTVIERCAFSESVLSIEPALTSEKWQLLRPDGTTPLLHPPTMPLTVLQKRWLKAISLDPRIRLFDFDSSGLEDVPPLFTPDDIYIFDRYADGDPFEDEVYIQIFHRILDAIKKRYPLSIDVKNRREARTHLNVMPEYLEYSEKDDKFRLVASGCRYGKTINLGRILSCKPFRGERYGRQSICAAANKRVVIELYDGRNALERVLLHFAHFEKEAQRLDEKHYRVTINYRQDDETELVIRVLSFGPFIKVTEPERFVGLIKKRLEMQKRQENFSILWMQDDLCGCLNVLSPRCARRFQSVCRSGLRVAAAKAAGFNSPLYRRFESCLTSVRMYASWFGRRGKRQAGVPSGTDENRIRYPARNAQCIFGCSKHCGQCLPGPV